MIKIEELEELARAMVGDGQAPNVFFVTDQGVVTLVSTSYHAAYAAWGTLRDRVPMQECALEDRLTGILASVEPEDDDSDILHVIDDN